MGKKEKERLMKIVATTSFAVVDRPIADRWNAARLCRFRSNWRNGLRVNMNRVHTILEQIKKMKKYLVSTEKF